jgi:hypothetical protein
MRRKLAFSRLLKDILMLKERKANINPGWYDALCKFPENWMTFRKVELGTFSNAIDDGFLMRMKIII